MIVYRGACYKMDHRVEAVVGRANCDGPARGQAHVQLPRRGTLSCSSAGATCLANSRSCSCDRLRRHFGIGRVCVVADRGMISAPTIAALEERGLEYVLGARTST